MAKKMRGVKRKMGETTLQTFGERKTKLGNLPKKPTLYDRTATDKATPLLILRQIN